MKLQILIPQYKETDAVIKPLLDSIALQQSVDFLEIGVLICNDGSDILLSDKLLRSYPFDIRYCGKPHQGVSATRNFLLEEASAEYIMFCDADDLFLSVLGLWQIFEEIEKGFDTLHSAFLEEIKEPETGKIRYDVREMDGIFVHGKVHRRQYLEEKKIRFDEQLTINEDSYFTALCQSLTKRIRYISEPFYVWKWRDDSVSHQDPKYEYKAYLHMIESNDALVTELLRRDAADKAAFYVMQMMMDAYYTLTDPSWKENENTIYYQPVLERFREWLEKYSGIWNGVPISERENLAFHLIGTITRKEAHKEILSVQRWIKEIGGTNHVGVGRMQSTG